MTERSDVARWQPGERITLRYVGHSHTREAGRPGLLQGWPYVVVEDSADWLALWMPVGTHMRLVDLADRARAVPDMLQGEHPYLEFRRGEVLRLMRPEEHSSIWLHWQPGEECAFLGWYVNIEAPYVRTPIGVDTTDLSLDLVVWPDFTWEWKDEHLEKHFEDLGVFTPDESRRIRSEGERVIEAVGARRPPFDGAWLDWRPPAASTAAPLPEVPADWDTHPDVGFPLFTRRRLAGLDPLFEAAGAAPRWNLPLSEVAARVVATPHRLADVRLVLVDGPAGSGKTTYAEALAAELGGAPVVHMDDLYEGWGGLGPGVYLRLEAQVLAPLREGRAARYHRYDWNAAAFREWVDLPRAQVLIIEGVGAAAQPVDPWAVLRVWVDAPRDLRLARGLERDGEARQGHWQRWDEEEPAHFETDRTKYRSDVRVDGTVPVEGTAR